jgi:hypothetical protein
MDSHGESARKLMVSSSRIREYEEASSIRIIDPLYISIEL